MADGTEATILVRDMDSAMGPGSERNYVFNSWLINASKFGKALADRTRTYYQQHHHCIESVLKVSTVRVAVFEHAPLAVLGYLVFEPRAEGRTGAPEDEMPPVVHFLFVKERYRRQGVAATLLADALGPRWKRNRVIYTHPLSRAARSPKPGARAGSAEAIDGTLPSIPPMWEFCAYTFLRV